MINVLHSFCLYILGEITEYVNKYQPRYSQPLKFHFRFVSFAFFSNGEGFGVFRLDRLEVDGSDLNGGLPRFTIHAICHASSCVGRLLLQSQGNHSPFIDS